MKPKSKAQEWFEELYREHEFRNSPQLFINEFYKEWTVDTRDMLNGFYMCTMETNETPKDFLTRLR